MSPVNANRRREVMRGELDVGRLFVDTKQIVLDARANAVELDQPRLRVDAMYVVVELLGRLIREVRVLRSEITRGEEGLAGFDADLAGLQQRYRNLYRPFFEGMTDPEQWTVEDWRGFEEDLEGPILLWDLKTCQERWGVAFASPPCEGPDLLMGLSLLHQTGIAAEHEAQLVASLYGLADLTMKDITETYGDLAHAAGRGIANGFGSVAEGVGQYFAPTKTTRNVVWGLGVAAVLGVSGYAWINAKTKKGK